MGVGANAFNGGAKAKVGKGNLIESVISCSTRDQVFLSAIVQALTPTLSRAGRGSYVRDVFDILPPDRRILLTRCDRAHFRFGGRSGRAVAGHCEAI